MRGKFNVSAQLHSKNASEQTSKVTLKDTSVDLNFSLIHFLWEQASSTTATPVGTEKRKKKDSPSSALPIILNGKASSEGPAGKKYFLEGQEEQSGGGEEEYESGETSQLGSTGIDQTAPICTKVGALVIPTGGYGPSKPYMSAFLKN
jgi:hypothetical protein